MVCVCEMPCFVFSSSLDQAYNGGQQAWFFSRNVTDVKTLPSVNTFDVSASLSGVARKHGCVGFDSSPNLATRHTIQLRLAPALLSLFIVVSRIVFSLRTFSIVCEGFSQLLCHLT